MGKATWTVEQTNWRFYQDQSEVIISSVPLANENVTPTLTDNADIIRLRIVIDETAGGGANNQYWDVEYSTDESSWNSLTSGNHWNWANGVATENDILSNNLISDGSDLGNFRESTGQGTYDYAGNENAEFDFAIQATATVSGGTTYYFRVLTSGDGASYTEVAPGATYSHPSVTTATTLNHYTLDATPNTSFTFTGNSANTLIGHKIIDSVNTYTFTGNDAGLAKGKTINAETVAFDLTGQDTNYLYSQAVEAGTGEFTYTLNDTNLLQGYRVDIGEDSFNLTGNDAGFVLGYKLTAEFASFTFTGNDQGLLKQLKIPAETEAFTFTGQDVNLNISITLPAETGAFDLTGNTANLLSGPKVTADAGDFTYTGQAVNFLKSITLPAENGSFIFTGNDASLIGGESITSEAGEFTLDGQDVNFQRTRIFNAGGNSVPDPFDFTGQNWAVGNGASFLDSDTVTFTANGDYFGQLNSYPKGSPHAWVTVKMAGTTNVDLVVSSEEFDPIKAIPAGPFDFEETAQVAGEDLIVFASGAGEATFTEIIITSPGLLTGNDAGLKVGRYLELEAGTFAFTGNDLNFLRGRGFSVEAGDYTLTGQDAGFLRSRVMSADPGSFSFTGIQTNLKRTYNFITESGTFTFTGNDAELRVLTGYELTAETGSFIKTGINVNFARGIIATEETGDFTITGGSTAFLFSKAMPASAGSFTITVNDANLNTGVARDGGHPITAITDRNPTVEITDNNPTVEITQKNIVRL